MFVCVFIPGVPSIQSNHCELFFHELMSGVTIFANFQLLKMVIAVFQIPNKDANTFQATSCIIHNQFPSQHAYFELFLFHTKYFGQKLWTTKHPVPVNPSNIKIINKHPWLKIACFQDIELPHPHPFSKCGQNLQVSSQPNAGWDNVGQMSCGQQYSGWPCNTNCLELVGFKVQSYFQAIWTVKQEKQCTGQLQVRRPWCVCFGCQIQMCKKIDCWEYAEFTFHFTTLFLSKQTSKYKNIVISWKRTNGPRPAPMAIWPNLLYTGGGGVYKYELTQTPFV